MHNLHHRVVNTEQRISDLEDTARPLQATFNDLYKDQYATVDKLTDLEDCLRRNNLRFLGFTEGRNPEAFMER